MIQVDVVLIGAREITSIKNVVIDVGSKLFLVVSAGLRPAGRLCVTGLHDSSSRRRRRNKVIWLHGGGGGRNEEDVDDNGFGDERGRRGR